MFDYYGEAIEAQISLGRFYQSDDGKEIMRNFYHGMEEDDSFDNAWAATLLSLSYGEPFYWSSPILSMVLQASKSIPLSWSLNPQDLPTPWGFFWFSRPIQVDQSVFWIRAISWIPLIWIEDDEGNGQYGLIDGASKGISIDPKRDALAVLFYGQGDPDGNPMLMPASLVQCPFLRPLKELTITMTRFGRHEVENRVAAESKLRLFASMISFIQQKILLPATIPVPRCTRRRLEKSGVGNLPLLRVIQLRKSQRKHFLPEESHIVEWQCQWIVRGHWRNQWYPGSGEWKPKWIAPHIKGPEDRPLRDPARLFAVVR